MVTLGVDAHKQTHTIVAVDGQGRSLAVIMIGTNTKDHLGLLKWAEQFGPDELLWGSRTAGTCPGGWNETFFRRASRSSGCQPN